MRVPPKILFDGSNLVVNDFIRENLLNYDMPNIFMHPAVYIHDDDKWYENYWYITFTEQFDCWDRKKSTYVPNPMTLSGKNRMEFSHIA